MTLLGQFAAVAAAAPPPESAHCASESCRHHTGAIESTCATAWHLQPVHVGTVAAGIAGDAAAADSDIETNAAAEAGPPCADESSCSIANQSEDAAVTSDTTKTAASAAVSAAAAAAAKSRAALFRLHALFVDGVVLSRRGAAAIVSFAPPRTSVTVTLTSRAGKLVARGTAKTENGGAWRAMLGSLRPATGLTLTARSASGIVRVARDVSVGELILMAGECKLSNKLIEMWVIYGALALLGTAVHAVRPGYCYCALQQPPQLHFTYESMSESNPYL